MECKHNWEWDIYRNPKKPKLYRKRYECQSCGKVKYSNSKNYYVDGKAGKTKIPGKVTSIVNAATGERKSVKPKPKKTTTR